MYEVPQGRAARGEPRAGPAEDVVGQNELVRCLGGERWRRCKQKDKRTHLGPIQHETMQEPVGCSPGADRERDAKCLHGRSGRRCGRCRLIEGFVFWAVLRRLLARGKQIRPGYIGNQDNSRVRQPSLG